MTPPPASIQRTATRDAIIGAVLLLLTVALGFWVLARGDAVFTIGLWWNETVTWFHTAALDAFALTMNVIGGGWVAVFVVPLGGALALVLLRRRWAALYFLAASALSALLVQVLKHAFGRVRPEEILIVSDYGSYPSGHVANAATIAICAIVLFPRIWVIVAGALWVVLMAFSRTYLHAHWLSDTAGGAMVGAAAALLLAAAFAVPLAREAARARAVAAD
jgi:membrane-associated phospholipid phosphatase